ncbi:hypothetical protein ACSVH2_10705 [Flavobacterium sp. RSB2_4_14]|uniref:hypothetical protein n=1 Tax=Flavobacterium sp. RSB2_4_14 TaxID=3447665 RepID=UPI003F2AD004
MNVKNFLIGGIVGGITDFLLGWLFYGILLIDFFPPMKGTENMLFIFLGCMSFGFLISFVFAQGESISKCVPGIKVAAGIGLFMSLCINFFNNMMNETIDVKMMATDVIVSVVLASIVGATIAVTIGKLK